MPSTDLAQEVRRLAASHDSGAVQELAAVHRLDGEGDTVGLEEGKIVGGLKSHVHELAFVCFEGQKLEETREKRLPERL